MTDASTIPCRIHVRFIDDIAIMWLNNGENRLNIGSVQGMNAALDEVERNETTKALIITGVGKYFSCGLDLAWLSNQDSSTMAQFFPAFENLLSRLLVFPLPTVAAINGHAYAAGGFIAMSCDYRIMRTQRGWICFPEINIKIPLRPYTAAFLRIKLKDNTLYRDMALYGQRLTGEEARERGVIDECVDMKDLIDSALAFTRKRIGTKGFDRTVLQQMKQNLYGNVCDSSKRSRDDCAMDSKSLREMFVEAHQSRL